MEDIYKEVSHLARLALAGREGDIQMFLRQLVKKLRKSQPETAKEVESLLAQAPTRSSPLREVEQAIPVDADSRLKLVRPEYPVAVDCAPIWAQPLRERLEQVLKERKREQELLDAGLLPTRSLLLVGPPGVGKSLCARWLASKLDRPLVTLDLSAVMSSYLGRTGANIRHVLEYAKSINCVLFLDELDAVAKRRDDDTEIGELKRLVTVLLQEIDGWPHTGILVAATNHPELLDPAAWRRFELVLDFPMPSPESVRQIVGSFLEPKGVDAELIDVASVALSGLSFSDIDRELQRVHRESVISGLAVADRLVAPVGERLKKSSLSERKAIAERLLLLGMSARRVNEWTGLHRTAIAKIAQQLQIGRKAS